MEDLFLSCGCKWHIAIFNLLVWCKLGWHKALFDLFYLISLVTHINLGFVTKILMRHVVICLIVFHFLQFYLYWAC